MKITRLLASSLAVVALCALGLSAQAQTGPIKGGGTDPKMGTAGPKMTPDRLLNLLKTMGHKAELKSFNNGAKTVIATIEKDDWRYIVEFEFTTDLKTMHLLSPLGEAIDKLTSAQAMALLRKSYDIGPIYHFSYRTSDKRICLENPLWNTDNFSDQLLNTVIDGQLKTIRNNQDAWDSSRFPGI